MTKFLSVGLLFTLSLCGIAQTGATMKSRNTLPADYWPLEKSQPIIDKTETIRLAPEISHLSEGERTAVAKMIEVGNLFQSLFEQQRHSQALTAYRGLVQLDTRTGSSAATQNLLTLYRLNQGPIAATLDNKREAFLPVDDVKPGKNVYPWGVKKEELDAFMSTHPEKRASILDLRTVVRRLMLANVQHDLATLKKISRPGYLPPGFAPRLRKLFAKKREGTTKSKVQRPKSDVKNKPNPG